MSAKKKPDLWMPLYFGAYLTDTMHLTCEQHGAYLLLLMACWKRGGMLPNDDEQLAAIAKLPTAKWKKARPIIAPFWQVDAKGWRQKRLTQELEAANKRSETARENGAQGGRPRKADDNPPDNPNETQDVTQQEPGTNPEESSVPLPLQEPLPPPVPAAPPTRAGAIALLLRRLASEKGKTIRIASVEKQVIAWADSGITDESLAAALELAIADRETNSDATALNPGFINVFVAKMQRPERTAVSGTARAIAALEELKA